MEKYLVSTSIIDWDTPSVSEKASELAKGLDNPADIAKACFVFVRDEIRHSADFQLNPVTCNASEVLEHKTGYCFAKSHLLAALLRANRIPAGICYQRLTLMHNRPPFILHALNAVHLPSLGWYRIDARGNKPGIDAQFTPPVEALAFKVAIKGEADLPEIWPEPLPQVVQVLRSSRDFQEVINNLPDIEVF